MSDDRDNNPEDKLIEFPAGPVDWEAGEGAPDEGDALFVVAGAGDEPRKALLLALDTGRYDAERSLQELAALAEADGCQPVAEVLQKRRAPDPATALGAGRLAEGRLLARNLGAQLAIYDGELSGSQLRNLEEHLAVPVIDRTMLILDIFARRATTHEGKLQTELATLQYRLPRLSGLGASLSRQGGGGGGGGGARRGGGETQLEYDRRYIRRRIAVLKKRLETVSARRGETRRLREKRGVPLIALVGYTNVGKSSLLNALTGSSATEADMLFATLDPTARSLTLPSGQAVILIDTVGFVSRLPHELVDSFKSTLEEAVYADLLVKVCDAADPESTQQLRTTDEVLAELGARAPQLVVYNKADIVPGFLPYDPAALPASAKTGEGLPALLAAMDEALAHRMRRLCLLLPYEKLALADTLRRHGHVDMEDFRAEGVYFEASVQAAHAHLFEAYLCMPAPEA